VSEDFVGSGWTFPIRTSPTGGIALVARELEIEESIEVILRTAPGDRLMRPEFGCRIHEFVFAPADATTMGLIAHEVRSALLRWEPRIELRDVRVVQDLDDPSTLYIDIDYAIRLANDPRNLVFPFYLLPAEAPQEQLSGLPLGDER
jgi:phage baseplate assembly protein W